MSWKTCKCGSDKFVAEQEVNTTKRNDGKLEQSVGPERVFCKKCGAPAKEGPKEDGGEVQVLVGVPKHLQQEFDESEDEEGES